jgi:sulfite exporter TauE/SafE
VSVEKEIKSKDTVQTTGYAIMLGFGILILFFLLQKTNILNIGLGGPVTPVTSFVIGLIASVSSCLAVVGGLILSLSAKVSQDAVSDTKTFSLFHVSRIISFAILGGVLGVAGSVIGINFTVSSILGIVASIIMLILGLNLLGVIEKNKFVFSTRIFNFFKSIEHKTFTPIILGFATFFLPCGFTQSMQFVALSSGSFTSGMYIMLAFAFGTLPMLLLLSFGSARIAQGRFAELFFKTVGVVVIGFGLFAFLSGLASLGIISPIIII